MYCPRVRPDGPVPEARKLSARDTERASVALASAFLEDPVMAWLMPQADRELRLKRFHGSFLSHVHLPLGHCWQVDDCGSVALWDPPGHWRVPLLRMLPILPSLVRAFGVSLRGLAVLGGMEKVHPREPHYYLAVLGTHRDKQGRGLGAAVLAPTLARADEEGLGCYLESSNERNVPFYRRMGFEETGRLPVAPGVNDLTLMWRPPRRSS